MAGSDAAAMVEYREKSRQAFILETPPTPFVSTRHHAQEHDRIAVEELANAAVPGLEHGQGHPSTDDRSQKLPTQTFYFHGIISFLREEPGAEKTRRQEE